MKAGDLVLDCDYGMSAIILEVKDECIELGNLPVLEYYYKVMYEDGSVENVRDVEVKPLGRNQNVK